MAEECYLAYQPVELWVRALNSDGTVDSSGTWYVSDNIIDWDFAPEIEEGTKQTTRCGGRVKNVMQEDDQMVGGTLKLTLCCEDPEIQYIVGGSVGTVVYDSSSPPVPIGYAEPTLDEQANALDFECRVYVEVINGSNVVGYKRLSFYDCGPAYFSEGGGQQESPTPEVTIKCSENPNYGKSSSPPEVKGVYDWQFITNLGSET